MRVTISFLLLQGSAPQKNRFVLLCSLGLLSLFGLRRAHFSGAGALGSLALSFVASLQWSKKDKVLNRQLRIHCTYFKMKFNNMCSILTIKQQIGAALSIVWDFFMPLLFSLIGAEVNVEYMESQLIGREI